jgi:hypothetical protein
LNVVVVPVGRLADPATGIVGPDRVIPPGLWFVVIRLLFLATLVVALVAVVSLVVGLLRRRRHPERRRVGWFTRAVLGLTVVMAVAVWWVWPPPFFVPTFPPIPPTLPANTFAYRPVGDLPVAAQSGAWVGALGSRRLALGSASKVIGGAAVGMPFNIADASTPMEDVSIDRHVSSSYRGRYPMTDPAYIQSMPIYHFDDHYLVIDPGRREVWELWMVSRSFGRWHADSGAHWSMDSVDYPVGKTIAAGLPILPTLVTYADVASGRVGHVAYVTQPTSRGFTWPARSGDGRSTDPSAPPQGAWFRLKAGADLSRLGPQARVVAKGLQEFGAILVDTSPVFSIRGTPDARWDDRDLATLSTLSTDDFEAVDPSGAVVSKDSLEMRPPA